MAAADHDLWGARRPGDRGRGAEARPRAATASEVDHDPNALAGIELGDRSPGPASV